MVHVPNAASLATVSDAAPTGQVQAVTAVTMPPLMRPALGGQRGGFHYGPDPGHDAPGKGDVLLVVYAAGDFPVPVGYFVSPRADLGQAMPSLQPGESSMVSKSGASIKLAANGDVLVTLASGQALKVQVGALGQVSIGPSAGDPTQVGVNGPHGQYVQFNATNNDMAVDAASGHLYLGRGTLAAVARVGDSVSVNLTTGNGTITSGAANTSAG